MAEMLSKEAIEGYKAHTDRTIAYAMYAIDGEFHRAAIHRRERLKDNKVAVYFSISPQSASGAKVTEVQLFDTNNDLFVSKREDIAIKGVNQGFLYRFTFDFKEV